MTKRYLALAATICSMAVAATFSIGLLVPESSYSTSTPTAVVDSAPRVVRLAPAPARSTGQRAFAASAYVHQAQCKAALTGANGDDDVGSWTAASHFGWGWSSFYDRVDSTHFIQYVDLYTNAGWWGTYAAYCMGNDAPITSLIDKFPDSPSGW